MTGIYAHESAVIDFGAEIGSGTKVWHFTHIMPSAKIGKNCTIGQCVFIGDGVVIGDNVKIQNNVSLYSGVVCEDDVFIGPSAVFTNVVNPRSLINRKSEYKRTIIRKGATIGANATIVCDVEIGNYAFIGAGAVITKSVKNYALMTGVPAKQSGWMSAYGSKLIFDENGFAICPLTLKTYIRSSEEEVKVQE